jgi:predicted ATPase
MTRPMIERLEIENYGCIKKAGFALTPLHAFIGPNDSGKSTILRAVRTLASAVSAETGVSQDVVGALSAMKNGFRLGVESASRFFVELVRGGSEGDGPLTLSYGQVTTAGRTSSGAGTFSYGAARAIDHPAVAALRGAQMLRLDPDRLRAPTNEIVDGQPARLFDERGLGLASAYQALVNRDVERFRELLTGVRGLFRDVNLLQVKTPSAGTRTLAIELNSGEVVSAQFMSEGLLYYLAFAILPYLDPTALLLVEEPENGLHPARIADVMHVLREISKTTQVLVATHSPLVINEMQPNEVTVVRRRGEEGTTGVVMKDTKDFAVRSSAYVLGELWLAYANGVDESPLIDGGPRP